MVDRLKKEVEQHGTFFERKGMTPMEARVFSLLLLADPPYMDFFAIQKFLEASKSSISNALNRLMNSKRVDYLTQPGDRKRYFRVNPGMWLEQMKQEIAAVAPTLELLNRVMQTRQDMDTPEFNRELERVRDFFNFMAEEFPKLLDRWDQSQENTKN